MQIIARKTIRKFWTIPHYRDSEESLKSWYAIAKNADWVSTHEVKQQFSNASILGGNRVAFNIAGNKND